MENKKQPSTNKPVIIFIICVLMVIIAMSKYTEHRQEQRINELEIISLDLADKLINSYRLEYGKNLNESIIRQQKAIKTCDSLIKILEKR